MTALTDTPLRGKVLPPIIDKPAYSANLEPVLQDYLDAVIFNPIAAFFESEGFTKVQDQADRREAAGTNALEAAIEAGRVWYADGAFCGQFNAAISRELRAIGATIDPTAGTFKIAQDRIPFQLRHGLAMATERSQSLHKDLDRLLAQMGENVTKAPAGLALEAILDRIGIDLQNQFVRQAMEVKPRDIAIGLKVDPAIEATLRKTLVENMEISIKDWASEEIVRLRERVQQNALAGWRPDRLARQIAVERGISARKANFISSQETSLFVSNWREERAKQLGSTRYKWSTSHDARVRPTRPGETNNHRVLNGRVFFWSDPPVVDSATGRKCHPGQDFGCRCVAMPIIDD